MVDTERKAEQQHLDVLYARLDELRVRSERALDLVRRAADGRHAGRAQRAGRLRRAARRSAVPAAVGRGAALLRPAGPARRRAPVRRPGRAVRRRAPAAAGRLAGPGGRAVLPGHRGRAGRRGPAPAARPPSDRQVTSIEDEVLDLDAFDPERDGAGRGRRGRADDGARRRPHRQDARHRRHHPGRAGPGDPLAAVRRARRPGRRRAPARPRSRCTAPRTCSTPTGTGSPRPACSWSARTSGSCATSTQVLPALGEADATVLATPGRLYPGVDAIGRRGPGGRGRQGRPADGGGAGPGGPGPAAAAAGRRSTLDVDGTPVGAAAAGRPGARTSGPGAPASRTTRPGSTFVKHAARPARRASWPAARGRSDPEERAEPHRRPARVPRRPARAQPALAAARAPSGCCATCTPSRERLDRPAAACPRRERALLARDRRRAVDAGRRAAARRGGRAARRPTRGAGSRPAAEAEPRPEVEYARSVLARLRHGRRPDDAPSSWPRAGRRDRARRQRRRARGRRPRVDVRARGRGRGAGAVADGLAAADAALPDPVDDDRRRHRPDRRARRGVVLGADARGRTSGTGPRSRADRELPHAGAADGAGRRVLRAGGVVGDRAGLGPVHAAGRRCSRPSRTWSPRCAAAVRDELDLVGDGHPRRALPARRCSTRCRRRSAPIGRPGLRADRRAGQGPGVRRACCWWSRPGSWPSHRAGSTTSTSRSPARPSACTCCTRGRYRLEQA